MERFTYSPFRLAIAAGLAGSGALLVAFLLFSALQQWRITHQAGHELQLARLTMAGSELVHQLQRERGLSAAVLGDDSATLTRQLTRQRTATDEALSRWQATYTSLRDALPESLEHTSNDMMHQRLDALGSTRELVDAHHYELDGLLRYYTEINRHLITDLKDASTHTDDIMIRRQWLSWYSLALLKDDAGLERALGAWAYANDAMPTAQFRRFMSLIRQQSNYLYAFRIQASPAMVHSGEAVMEAVNEQDIEAERDWIVRQAGHGGFDRDPSRWFSLQTTRIDHLHTLEGRVFHALKDTLDRRDADAEHALWSLAAASIALTAGLMAAGIYLWRRRHQLLCRQAPDD
ncbi:nitrate- and nitrite sensing domain-containing protein [Larsenimonas rhizosphaerae]|uniref:nitrate- and nitrite sensing domain-containing protein n=1 Tax=Larsenimonas rhizosphaerae TaxID=2944682 RepID=UPI0020346C6A|nr:nitrate- and nitrite sensing domain-containing protein [Larsenimonas rhizosphaerae]MCM2129753.1 nitrate- and nitrite sensing domain-containing protein [Larsenimonas rhizosphaerae]